MRVQRTTVGLDKVQEKLAKWVDLGMFLVRVQTKATVGMRYSAERGAWTMDGHDARRNAIKVRAQAKAGRNWFFVDKKEEADINIIWKKAINIYQRTGEARGLERAAQDVGDYLVRIYQKHMREGRRVRGKVKDITYGTKLSKVRELYLTRPATGGTREQRRMVNKSRRNAAMSQLPPPGVRTGQGIDSLTAKVKRIHG